MKTRILIVDDEEDILYMLKQFFELKGYLVYTARNGEEAVEKIQMDLDIVLLDINIPGLNGIEVCKKIRSYVQIPILFLTAKIEEEDKVNGLMAGGDDYITKPFSLKELGARVEAHLRREQRKVQKGKLAFIDEIVIQYSERKVLCRDNEVKLTKTEFDILELLSLHSGQIFSKETIYERLWGFEKDGDSNIIMEHIRRIRSKLNKYSDKELIETVWGVGYRWIG